MDSGSFFYILFLFAGNIPGKEWNQRRCFFCIGAELRQRSVGLVLAAANPPNAGKHNTVDVQPADNRQNPLNFSDCTYAGEQHTEPKKHFAEIVGASHKPIEAGHDRGTGILRL